MKQGNEGGETLASCLVKRLTGWHVVAVLLFGILFAMSSSIFAAEPEDTPVYDIPLLKGIVVDGRADDWGDNGFKVEAMAGKQGEDKTVADLDARFRVVWDEYGLRVFVVVKDDAVEASENSELLYQKDAVEIFLADKRGGKEMIQVIVAPATNPKRALERFRLYDRRSDPELKKIAYEPICVSTAFDGGYVVEAALPWKGLGVTPEQGAEVGLQVFVEEYDPNRRGVLTSTWYPGGGTHLNSQRMHRLRLSDKPSEPVLAVGRLRVEGYRHILAKAIGDVACVGSELQVEVSGKVMGVGTFNRNGERATASVRLAIPPEGTIWPSVDFKVGDRLIERVAMPDLESARKTAMRNLNLKFDTYCFRGEKLPEGQPLDPVEAKNLLGSYEVEVSFYDSEYQKVTSAAKPGRYAAYVKIIPGKGDVLHRFVTLFRLPDEDGWDLPAQNTLEEVCELAHRFDTPPEEKVTTRNNPRSKEQLWLHGLKKKLGLFEPYRYHVHVPKAVTEKKEGLCPAMVFLHGGAGLRRSFEEVKDLIPMDYERDDFPFYLFTPHSGGQRWQRTHLDELLDELLERYPIDPDRIYLTGLSMGGMGTWMYAAARPDRFAAVAPVCGGGDPDEAEYLKDLPIWNFHGDADPVVPIENSEEMIFALEKVNGRVRYTIYRNVGHNVYEYSYADPELFPWMLKQVRGKPAQPRGVDVRRIKPATEEAKKVDLFLVPEKLMAEARMAEGIAGVGVIRSVIRVYAAAHDGRCPVIPKGTTGASLGKLNVEPSDLEGKYFKATDYTVVSNTNGYKITATDPESGLKYEINQDGDETSGKGYYTMGR